MRSREIWKMSVFSFFRQLSLQSQILRAHYWNANTLKSLHRSNNSLKGLFHFPSPFSCSLCVLFCVSPSDCVFLYSFLTLLCFLFALFHLPVRLPFAFMWQRNSCLVQGIRLARQSGCRLRRARTLSSLSPIQARTHTPLSYSHTSHMLTSI